MKCKDILDKPVVEFVRKHGGVGCNWYDLDNNPRSVVHAMPKGMPQKLVLAKMKQLLKRGLVNGCGCGCRGDFEITDKGNAFLSTE